MAKSKKAKKNTTSSPRTGRANNHQTEKVMLTFNTEELGALEKRRLGIAKQLDAPLALATMCRSMVLAALRADK